MEEVEKFLKEAETYYLATVEGDQPRVRPFGTAHIFEGKLYIQTGKKKDVSKQLHANPKAELCAFKGGDWIRVAGELEEEELEARLDEISEREQVDVIIVTTNSLEGKTAQAYADDYFIDHGYGQGEDGDGILFLVGYG